jgi:hypothetical protein
LTIGTQRIRSSPMILRNLAGVVGPARSKPGCASLPFASVPVTAGLQREMRRLVADSLGA